MNSSSQTLAQQRLEISIPVSENGKLKEGQDEGQLTGSAPCVADWLDVFENDLSTGLDWRTGNTTWAGHWDVFHGELQLELLQELEVREGRGPETRGMYSDKKEESAEDNRVHDEGKSWSC